jgi:serine phosphatase RsbU (regulator of sigma subunit)
MGLAAEMQWQLLPPLTFVTPRVVIAGLLEPAYEVAGDAFDYALNGDTAHLAVIDPVGHDITASVLAGVTEGRNLAGEPFGEARLADLLVRATLAGQPAAETMRRLAHAILAHQGRTPRDDATMVFLEWPGPPS